MTRTTRTTRTTRPRTATAALGLALAAGLTGTTTTTAHGAQAAAAAAAYQQTDRTGDVSTGNKKGITKAQRRSIDLSRVRIVPDDAARTVRMVVTIRDVTRPKRFVQGVTLLFSKADGTAIGSAAFSPTRGQRAKGRAVFDAGDDITSCTQLRTRTARDSVVSVAVPTRCVPDVPVQVSTTTTTKRYPSAPGYYSLDSLRSDGTHRLRSAG